MKTMPLAAYALLVLFGGLLMVLGIIMQGDLAGRVVFLAFGTICLVAAAVLRILGGPRA
jgi:hypothetical protein